MIERNTSNFKQFTEEDLQTAAKIMSEIGIHLRADPVDNSTVHDAALTLYRTGEAQTMEQAFAESFSEFLTNFKIRKDVI